MRFIDLFAGLGGFNLALSQLGHNCVFACEKDLTLRDLYEKNFGIVPAGDIREVNVDEIPDHEILCAGFPCQPFSKAGQQDGLNDPELGILYEYIIKIIKRHNPKYFILENVPNFEIHDDRQTWAHIRQLLENEKYTVQINQFSPDEFDIPQIRKRVYIIGRKGNLDGFQWPNPPKTDESVTVESYLYKNPEGARKLPGYINDCLDVWQEFLDNIPSEEGIPDPLWSMEFGATYPYTRTTPYRMTFSNLRKYKGTYGQFLKSAIDKQTVLALLPSHARREQDVFPAWKIKYIRKNREFYLRHKNWLDSWIPKIRKFSPSLQKLEWHCQRETDRNIRHYILQIRPSGVRVKKRTTIPSLVAMTATQVPIIAWENRYVTPKECLRLQSMDGLRYLPESRGRVYEALGNAINVKVAKLVAKALVGESIPSKQELEQMPTMYTI